MTTAAVLDSVETLAAAVSEFLKHADNGGLSVLSDEQFAETIRDVEQIRRQLATADYPIIDQIGSRELPGRHLTRTVAGYLGQVWRLTPSAAGARVREAAALAPRTTLTGEPLPPVRAHTAQARRAGTLDDAQVAVIVRTLDGLPHALPVHELELAEATLVQAAHALNATELGAVATRLTDTIDPDGTLASDTDQQRRRYLTMRPATDGMVAGSFRLDDVAGARALAVFSALAAPRPADESGRDERSAGQRAHDAFADILSLALRAEDHASDARCGATLHLTMSQEQFESGTGHAVTTHGHRIRITQSLRLLDQTCVAWAVHDSHGAILNHGRTRRHASPGQVDTLITRDGGCAFPACTIPAEWCERHHVIAWQHGGPTNLDNLVLVCSYHHARHLQHGWTIQMRHGTPWFIPPTHIDPTRTPLRNIRGLKANPLRR